MPTPSMPSKESIRSQSLRELKLTLYSNPNMIKVYLFTIFIFSCSNNSSHETKEKEASQRPHRSPQKNSNPPPKQVDRKVKNDEEPEGLIPIPPTLLKHTEEELRLDDAKAVDLAARLKKEIHAKNATTEQDSP